MAESVRYQGRRVASGSVTLNVSGVTVSELAAGSLQTSGESFSNDDTITKTR